MNSSISSHISPSTTGLESRYHALTPDRVRLLGSCKGLQDFLPRAVDFLRVELTGRNATLIAAYLMGGEALPEGLDAPAVPIGDDLKEHLYELLGTPRFGLVSWRESAQKTFEKLDWLNRQVQELTRTVRQMPSHESCSALKFIQNGILLTRSLDPDDVAHFFRVIYRNVSNRDAHVFAERWTAFSGYPLKAFMKWLEWLWTDGLSGREHQCLMHILDAMLVNANFRNLCFDLSRYHQDEGPSSGRLKLLTMQIGWLECQAKDGELTDPDICQLGRSIFWMKELTRIVQNLEHEDFFKAWKGDKESMVLSLQFHLHTELKLSGVPIEPYTASHCDKVKEVVKVVRARIREIELGDGGERLRDFLMRWSPWRPLIERRHSGLFLELDARFTQLVDEHHEQGVVIRSHEDGSDRGTGTGPRRDAARHRGSGVVSEWGMAQRVRPGSRPRGWRAGQIAVGRRRGKPQASAVRGLAPGGIERGERDAGHRQRAICSLGPHLLGPGAQGRHCRSTRRRHDRMAQRCSFALGIGVERVRARACRRAAQRDTQKHQQRQQRGSERSAHRHGRWIVGGAASA